MPLTFRLATESDYRRLGELVITSFQPITWFKRADAIFGPLVYPDAIEAKPPAPPLAPEAFASVEVQKKHSRSTEAQN